MGRRALVHGAQHTVQVCLRVASGTDLFHVICDRDMEGVVAKQANARYTPDATTWVKIKNRHYSQAVERQDLFDKARQ